MNCTIDSSTICLASVLVGKKTSAMLHYDLMEGGNWKVGV